MPDPREVRIGRRPAAPGLQRHCDSCRALFRPHPRLGARQKTCGKDACRKSHRAAFRRGYRKQNQQAEQDIRVKRKAGRPPDFWKNYRLNHPHSTARNRAFSRLRKKLARAGLQRQLDIVQLIVLPGKMDQVTRFATSHRSLLDECVGKSAA